MFLRQRWAITPSCMSDLLSACWMRKKRCVAWNTCGKWENSQNWKPRPSELRAGKLRSALAPGVVSEIQLPGILIIGYGNLLRGDDATGVLAARELEHYFQDDDEVEVIAAQQLTPEMAEIVSRSSFVLFLDASQEFDPGNVRCVPVEPGGDACRFTHHLTPASLL